MCCAKNLGECCNKNIYWDPKHPDHKTCCEANPKECEVNPEPCESKEKYDPKSETHLKCCLTHFVKDWCNMPNCKKDVFPDEKKKKTKDWIACCALFPEHDGCENKDCKEVFLAGDAKSPAYVECCEEQPLECPNPNPECYPKTVFTDASDPKHAKCCKLDPSQKGCDTNKKCTNEVFQNAQHPDFEFCCDEEEYKDRPECNKPIPCITECAEDNEVVEEFFNKEGFVTMKGRMKKKHPAAHLVKQFVKNKHHRK